MTKNTKSFHVAEQHGVVVITPLGDTLSFRDVDIQREGQEIVHFLKTSGSKRLIIDLGHSNYFGSLMLGLFNSFGQTVKDQGGQMIFCAASDEMKSVMNIMKIDSIWPNLPTKNDAMKVAQAWK